MKLIFGSKYGPLKPDMVINTDKENLEDSVNKVLSVLKNTNLAND